MLLGNLRKRPTRIWAEALFGGISQNRSVFATNRERTPRRGDCRIRSWAAISASLKNEASRGSDSALPGIGAKLGSVKVSLLFATPGSILFFPGPAIGSVIEHLPSITQPAASSPSSSPSSLRSSSVLLSLRRVSSQPPSGRNAISFVPMVPNRPHPIAEQRGYRLTGRACNRKEDYECSDEVGWHERF